MATALLFLLPSFLLAAALFLRRYPGSRRLVALALSRRTQRTRRQLPATWRGRPRARVPRGGLLIASSLAVRPPPPHSLAT